MESTQDSAPGSLTQPESEVCMNELLLLGIARDARVEELKGLRSASLRLIDAFLGWDLLVDTQGRQVLDDLPREEFSMEVVASRPLARYSRRILVDALQEARRAGLLTVLDIHCKNKELPMFGSELCVMEANLANDIEANAFTVPQFIMQLIADGLLSELRSFTDFGVLNSLLDKRDQTFLKDRITRVNERWANALREGE
jgi:hypothetical protein